MNRRVILIAHVVAIVALLLAAAGFLYWQHPASAQATSERHATVRGEEGAPRPDARR